MRLAFRTFALRAPALARRMDNRPAHQTTQLHQFLCQIALFFHRHRRNSLYICVLAYHNTIIKKSKSSTCKKRGGGYCLLYRAMTHFWELHPSSDAFPLTFNAKKNLFFNFCHVPGSGLSPARRGFVEAPRQTNHESSSRGCRPLVTKPKTAIRPGKYSVLPSFPCPRRLSLTTSKMPLRKQD